MNETEIDHGTSWNNVKVTTKPCMAEKARVHATLGSEAQAKTTKYAALSAYECQF